MNTSSPTYSGNTIENSDYQGIRVDGSMYSPVTTIVWENIGLPYIINSAYARVNDNTTLQLPAGTVIKFGYYTDHLDITGNLTLHSTEVNPVVFTSLKDDVHGGDSNGDASASSPSPNNWGYLKLNNDNISLHDIKLMYADEGIYINDCSPSITNNYIEACYTSCIYLNGDNMNPTITNNDFINIGKFGVKNTESYNVDARNNWWGHSSGPYYSSSNPNGQGSEVSNYVLFNPYQSEPNNAILVTDPIEDISKDMDFGSYLAESNLNNAFTSLLNLPLSYSLQVNGSSITANVINNALYIYSISGQYGDNTMTITANDGSNTASDIVLVKIIGSGPTVPTNTTVSNESIQNNVSNCYNATNTITVAGSGNTVDVQSGGEATFIAGNKIVFNEGFTSHLGSYSSAYITTTSDYCSQQQNMAPETTEISYQDDSSTFKDMTIVESDVDNTLDVNIYPNPTTGEFIIDFIGYETTAEISLHNYYGMKVHNTKIYHQKMEKIDISDLPGGIYIVVISTNTEKIIRKIVKTF
jgi:hypothetical protein